jgi:hypothetical protein
MVPPNENYVILNEVLRKMDFDENYKPTERELKIVTSLLEREEKSSPKRSKVRKPTYLE